MLLKDTTQEQPHRRGHDMGAGHRAWCLSWCITLPAPQCVHQPEVWMGLTVPALITWSFWWPAPLLRLSGGPPSKFTSLAKPTSDRKGLVQNYQRHSYHSGNVKVLRALGQEHGQRPNILLFLSQREVLDHLFQICGIMKTQDGRLGHTWERFEIFHRPVSVDNRGLVLVGFRLMMWLLLSLFGPCLQIGKFPWNLWEVKAHNKVHFVVEWKEWVLKSSWFCYALHQCSYFTNKEDGGFISK